MARLTRAEAPLVVSFVNQNVITLAWRSTDFAYSLMSSDILLRDGLGMEFCLGALGRRAGRNMVGTDFIPRIVAAFSGKRAALFGTEDPWTSRAASAIAALGCQVVSTMNGFQPELAYVAEAERTRPDLVILAMGNPKQEMVASRIAASVGLPVVIVNGGAIADVLAGRFTRAPLWVRRARWNGYDRLMQEPRRLWRRYLLGGLSFAWYVTRLRIAASI